MLHVTNGDAAASRIRRAKLGGDVLPWRDVLHEGPVPGGLSLREMSDVRASFLAELGLGAYEDIRRDMAERDDALLAAEHVVLWFEHDLYDQLQLIQILTALSPLRERRQVELICIGSFPGIVPFHGLGQLRTEHIATLWPDRSPVMNKQYDLACRAWSAFSSGDAEALRRFVHEDLSALRFLRGALVRQIEEFPSEKNGLGRTEQQILEAVAAGRRTFVEVFLATQAMEPAVYMGDTTLQRYIDRLTGARVPLLTREPMMLTDAGRRVLKGELDHRELNGVDRWIGGCHVVYTAR